MNKLIFATSNRNKIDEITSQVGDSFEIVSMKEAGMKSELEEPYDSMEQNAAFKCEQLFSHTQMECFAEDSGLEVLALDGAPGVYSARYAGENADDQSNMDKLLNALEGIEDRSAQFRTVISFLHQGSFYFFQGICPGKVTNRKIGDNGFGYDPVFIPDGADITFGQMNLDQKKKFSHRAKATAEFLEFLSAL